MKIEEIEEIAQPKVDTEDINAEKKGNGGVVFCMFPVEFEDLKQVADLDGVMPPKSTFFEPRMKNGLLVYEI